MSALKDRLENALNEGRILMLCVQVLIGFDYRAIFEDKFSRLPLHLQELRLASLMLMLCSLTLLISLIPYHWISGRGQNYSQLHGFAQKVVELALAPFALAMSCDLYVASSQIVSRPWPLVISGATAALAATFWFGIGYFKRKGKRMPAHDMDSQLGLTDRIKEVLVETRITLPGVQATLGFQFIIVLASGFDSLPGSLKMVHLASLLCSALCAILLIAPAAYHRIALRGEDSEELLRFASVMVLCALVPLSLALSGDVTVVVWKVTQQMNVAIAMGAGALFAMMGFWFGYMSLRRRAA